MDSYEENVFKALYSRRSIRQFEETRKVEKEKILKLLKAAMSAPSACNIQPWDFIVVDDAELIGRIKETCGAYGDYNTPLMIVVCGNNSFIPWKDFGIVDCAAAMENIMIAAPALGLGTVCVGSYNKDIVGQLLSIPENSEAVGLLYAGYPAEKKEPRTKYLEEAVHWNRFNAGQSGGPRPGNILEFGPEASL